MSFCCEFFKLATDVCLLFANPIEGRNMSLANVLFLSVVLLTAVNCQSQPQLKHGRHTLSNNSYIYYHDIRDGDSLKCVTDNVNCCNSSIAGVWRDESGVPVYACLYVTRGDGVISLHRKIGCTSDHTSGLWRCDIPDSSGEMQSLYVYIGLYQRWSDQSTS